VSPGTHRKIVAGYLSTKSRTPEDSVLVVASPLLNYLEDHLPCPTSRTLPFLAQHTIRLFSTASETLRLLMLHGCVIEGGNRMNGLSSYLQCRMKLHERLP